jgi:hypothetical protein
MQGIVGSWRGSEEKDSQFPKEKKGGKGKTTHHLDRLSHLQLDHHDRQPPSAHRTHRDFSFLLPSSFDLLLLLVETLDCHSVGALDVAHLGATIEDAHVVELREKDVLVFRAERVGGRKAREEVGETADLSTDLVIGVVVLTTSR